MDAEDEAPGWHEYMVASSRQFAQDFLAKEPVIHYAVTLLSMYSQCFKYERRHHPAQCRPPAGLTTAVDSLTMRGLAHVADRGDRRCGPDHWLGQAGSGLAIEGFALYPEPVVFWSDVEYRSTSPDTESTTAWSCGGEFCSSRGRDTPLRALEIRLRGEARERYDLEVGVRFVDGSATVVPSVDGTCTASGAAASEAFQARLRPQ